MVAVDGATRRWRYNLVGVISYRPSNFFTWDRGTALSMSYKFELCRTVICSTCKLADTFIESYLSLDASLATNSFYTTQLHFPTGGFKFAITLGTFQFRGMLSEKSCKRRARSQSNCNQDFNIYIQDLKRKDRQCECGVPYTITYNNASCLREMNPNNTSLACQVLPAAQYTVLFSSASDATILTHPGPLFVRS